MQIIVPQTNSDSQTCTCESDKTNSPMCFWSTILLEINDEMSRIKNKSQLNKHIIHMHNNAV